MMYRDWREVTKILLGTKGSLSDARLPKAKLKRPETTLYVKWIKGEIRRDRRQFEDFGKGKGIIATRERFLKWMETGEAEKAAVDEDVSASNITFGKTIILPIAIPGAGKGFVFQKIRVIFLPYYRKNIYLSGSRTSLRLWTHSKRRLHFQEGCPPVHQERSGAVEKT
jgi:tRNA ligase